MTARRNGWYQVVFDFQKLANLRIRTARGMNAYSLPESEMKSPEPVACERMRAFDLRTDWHGLSAFTLRKYAFRNTGETS
ncbi:MAG: hypothetical protein KDA96_25560 [Planctomycetaceae bacterium]|nr:hypothetical protein [Planctomycetaceae bacterium]